MFVCIMYIMSGLHQSWYRFGVMVMLGSMLGYAQAQLCAQVSRSAIQGFVLMAILCCSQLLFSGYLIDKESLPESLRWAVYSSFMRWVTGQIMMNEFDGLLGYQGNIVLELWGYNNFEFYRSRNMCLLYFFGLEFLIFLAVFFPLSSVTKIQQPSTETEPVIEEGCDGRDEGGETVSTTCYSDDKVLLSKHIVGDKCVVRSVPLALEEGICLPQALPLDQSSRVDFVFCGITYALFQPAARGEGSRGMLSLEEEVIWLLKGVDGCVLAGEMCAVMGLSGSGKHLLRGGRTR